MRQNLLITSVRLSLRFLLKILSVLEVSGKWAGFCIAYIGKATIVIMRTILPGVLFAYLQGRRAKLALEQACRFLKVNRRYCISHRYFAYGLVGVLTLFASVPSLRAADAPPGTFGENMLLGQLVREEETLTIDDTLPPDELFSYLEARFQNKQAPPEIYDTTREPRLSLTLDGVALLKQEVPGTIIPITRTEITEYRVEPGDTIWGIAEKFGIPVATVLWENGLNLYSVIRPGQTLTLLPLAGVTHTVKAGDTLAGIAQRYHGSADEILAYNKINGDSTLAIGTKLVVPGGKPYIPPAPPKPAPKQEVAVYAPVAVEPGGKFLWPVKSQRITQYFRWRHTGLDIGDKAGAPIYAAESGMVKIAGWGSGGWGYTVLLDHGNGVETRYAHASKILIDKGQHVSKGEVIALVGSTGRSTGPHLHLGVYVNGRAVNPLEYLK